MDPVLDTEWLGFKNDAIEETPSLGNIARSWQWRERGINPPNSTSNKTVLENVAEDILVQKTLTIRCCDLPGYPRSTFLMVFSPDGTKLASTHGNHNVYVSELASGKHVRILKGHPRTPWCIAFHPSHTQLIGSGCLGGQVRVWDISSGGSEVWNVSKETVIASIAFHPREQLLVIATYNELYFWDWSQPAPFTKVSTNNINEKVRYVAFDPLGYKLITGISLRSVPGRISSSVLQQNPTTNPTNTSTPRREDSDNPGDNRTQDNSRSAQDVIVNSYQNLVQRYDSLVRNYQRLFMVRHRLTATPPPPSTTDRGTDPMETDPSPEANSNTRVPRSYTSTPLDDENPTTGTSSNRRETDNVEGERGSSCLPKENATTGTSSNRQETVTVEGKGSSSCLPEENTTTGTSSNRQETDNAEGEGSSSRLLNLDALSFNSGFARDRNSTRQEHSVFGSRPSAFHPLNDTSGRSFRTVDQNERARLLPNPFSSTSGTPRATRISFASLVSQESPDNLNANSSRTSIFPAYRSDSPSLLQLSNRRWGGGRRIFVSVPNENSSTSSNTLPTRTSRQTTHPTSTTNATQTTSATTSQSQSSADAQTINESLDLIRDILRDSGTRLLNLITDTTLSSFSTEEDVPLQSGRMSSGSRAQSDDPESGERPRASTRPRVRLFSSSLHPGILSSSSESDSDQSPEVNIFRTRNSTFREHDTRNTEESSGAGPSNSSDRGTLPLDRQHELGEFRLHNPNRETSSINVSTNSSQIPARTQNNAAGDGPSTSNTGTQNNAAGEGPSTSNTDNLEAPVNSEQNDSNDINSSRPSTSEEHFWGTGRIPPEEAFRKVRGGVNAMQKHTTQLTNMWLRGNRATMPELRNMWENLRRRILVLHRETGRHDLPSHYSRSLLERCMMLTEVANNITRAPSRNSRTQSNNQVESTRNTESTNTENVPTDEPEQGPSRESPNNNKQSSSSRSPQTRSSNFRSSPSLRRRLQSSYRWRFEDEIRRRLRNPAATRLPQRHINRPRRDFARAMEISATRHDIRMRAMQVLSIMFNMMMMCLEERGLSQLIINMLRSLKKALAITCLMLMTNRNNGRASNNSSPQRVDSLNVIRLENVDHTGPVNVDGPDEPPPNTTPSDVVGDRLPSSASKRIKRDNSTSAQPISSDSNTQETSTSSASTSTQSNITQRWSNRLAIQISAANRNYSMTARNRRNLYIESRRLKALHKTNPIAHPLIKKRVLPPVSSHRIPALRLLPNMGNTRCLRSARTESQSTQPVAGPSGLQSSARPSRLPPEMMNEFEHRINLIRLAHMQAVRLRNAARSRYRRMQTIRFYSPSSVRQMFNFPPSDENHPENGSSMQDQDPSRWNLNSIEYRPLILTRERMPRGNTSGLTDEARLEEYREAIIENARNASVPLVQVGELSISNSDSQGTPPQRLPRIHEYLQPIILAQNSMVIDDDGNGEGNGGGRSSAGGGLGAMRRMGGMAGLLDASIISDLPVPSHRVQAWDFTTGNTPDIADSSKNMVVQRCRIHNDASIDISKDGRILVALHPVPRLRNTNHWLGVYSLEWSRLGQCLHTAALEHSAVSVALSPTARHLAVGLGSRRFALAPHARNNVFALLYRLDPSESTSRTGLSPIKELEKTWEGGFTSLNCLRWAPQPGQGLVYANNTGQLIIMS